MNATRLHLHARGLAGHLALLDTAQPGGAADAGELAALALVRELAADLLTTLALHRPAGPHPAQAARIVALLDATLTASRAACSRSRSLADDDRSRLLDRAARMQAAVCTAAAGPARAAT